MNRRACAGVFIAIVVAAALLRSVELFKPWVGFHNAWGGAMYGHIARNYLKYGYGVTQLGPVVNYGRASPGEFEYYYHYPPLSVWLYSLSDHVFGVHEWSARLVPLVFSLLIIVMTYLTGMRWFGPAGALVAALLVAVMPMDAYYAAHVDVYNSISVFFTLLAWFGYACWLDTRRGGHLAICVTGVGLGCMTSWYTYFIAPLILLHFWRMRRSDADAAAVPRRGEFFRVPRTSGARAAAHRADAWILVVPVCAMLIFGLFLAHRQHILAGHDEIRGTLSEKFWIRFSYGNLIDSRGEKVTLVRFLINQCVDLLRLYTPPVILLAVGWMITFFRDALCRRVNPRDWLILILFGYGFLHNAIFPSVVGGHDYLVCCYTPALALAATAISLRGYGWIRARAKGGAARGCALAGLAILVSSGLFLTYRQYTRYPDESKSKVHCGMMIQKHTGEADIVLAPTRSDQVMQYYADRTTTFNMDTLEKIEITKKDESRRYIFVCPKEAASRFAGLLEALNQRYEMLRESDPAIFDLSQPPS